MSAEKKTFNEFIFHHRVPIQIRFDDIDRMGHVNNTVLMSYFDYGKVCYFQFLNPELIYEERAPFIIVHYETDFYQPVFAQEEIFVQTKITGFGEKSVEFIQRIVCGEKIKCVCRTIMAGFNHQTQTSERIPEAFKDLARKIEISR